MVVVPRSAEGPGQKEDSPTALMVGQLALLLAALAQHIARPPLNVRVEFTTRSDDAVERVRDHPFHLVFCELRASPISGPELATRLAEVRAGTRVVLLADSEDRSLLVNSLECGAAGFFTEDSKPAEFVDGVRAVLAGHYAVGANLVKPVLAGLTGQAHSGNQVFLRQLSPTEKRILLMVAQAQQVHSIAEACGSSEKTVRNHLVNIYQKLGLRNRSEVVLWSARMGLTESLLSQQPEFRTAPDQPSPLGALAG